MKTVTYIENVVREVTVELKDDELDMEVWDIDSDPVVRERVFSQAALCGWDAEEVLDSSWNLND